MKIETLKRILSSLTASREKISILQLDTSKRSHKYNLILLEEYVRLAASVCYINGRMTKNSKDIIYSFLHLTENLCNDAGERYFTKGDGGTLIYLDFKTQKEGRLSDKLLVSFLATIDRAILYVIDELKRSDVEIIGDVENVEGNYKLTEKRSGMRNLSEGHRDLSR